MEMETTSQLPLQLCTRKTKITSSGSFIIALKRGLPSTTPLSSAIEVISLELLSG
ncbi:hypothetical protein JG688_00015619 [Phytophthora aleatoria]|uniref:Uncharacterized protein n=1 Tax=Phytophthora aleatoria TaxID=2496075 RepID=A0A8J5MCV5_9STRA|nr:hypothetical protein JG688_00015619 [Phytophthora aleatoria]